jgi:hypothetical protein
MVYGCISYMDVYGLIVFNINGLIQLDSGFTGYTVV